MAGLTDDPTIKSLMARLELLEKRQLSVKDLPIRKLQDKLERDWQPNASLLLQKGSIGPELLAASVGSGRMHTDNTGLSAAFATGGLAVTASAGGPDLALSVTPPYACWWPVTVALLARTTSAAWFRLVIAAELNVADVDGVVGASTDIQHHSGAADLVGGTVTGLFKLAANTTYTATVKVYMNGGTWQYYRQNDRTFIHSPGIIRR